MIDSTKIHDHSDEIVTQILDGVSPENVRTEGVKKALSDFKSLNVDVKLAILYYLYTEMGKSVTPAAPGAADVELTNAFFDEFNTLPLGDAQLDAMRSLVRGDDSSLCRTYGTFSENNKLVTWYFLAVHMGNDVIGMPEDYVLSDAGKSSLEAIKLLDFEQQFTFLRDVASAMGKNTIEHVA